MALNKIQGLHNNIIIKILLILIALTFIWSLGDFSNFTNKNYVAMVGDKVITTDDYRRAHDKFMQHYGDSFQGMKAEELEKLGIKRLIVNSLIQEKLKDLLVDRMDLRISDSQIIKLIKSNPEFQTNNHFDIERFKHFLNSSHLSEREFAAIFTESVSKSILFNNLISSLVPNKSLAKTLYEYNFEKKYFDLYVISPGGNVVRNPSDSELEEYFSANKESYMKPQTRQVKLITLDSESFKETAAVTDSEITEYYQSNIQQFVRPETRDFVAYIFDTKQKAEDASKLSEAQLSLDKAIVKKEYKSVARDNLANQIADIIFNEKVNVNSAVFENEGKFWIVTVVKITPANELTLDKVRSQIASELKSAKQNANLTETIYKIEDEISGSNEIEEIAKKYNLKTQDLVITQNQDKLPGLITENIFKSDGSDTEIAAFDNKYYIFKTLKITSAAPEELSSIKNLVLADYKKAKTQKELTIFADLVSSTLSSGGKVDVLVDNKFLLVKQSNLEVTRLNIIGSDKINNVPDEFVKLVSSSFDSLIKSEINSKIYIANVTQTKAPEKIDQDKLKFIENKQVNDYDKSIEQEILFYLSQHYNTR